MASFRFRLEQVVTVERMTSLAMSLSIEAIQVSFDRRPSPRILFVRYDFKVKRVAASRVSAQMVEVHLRRDCAVLVLEHNPMDKLRDLLAWNTDVDHAVALIIYRTTPCPTSIVVEHSTTNTLDDRG